MFYLNSSEVKFGMNLSINNLLDQEIHLKETSSSSLRRIESSKSSSSSSSLVQIEMEKFDLNHLETCEDPKELIRMINERLNIQFALSDDQTTENLFHVKLGVSNDMKKYLSKLFKCPIELGTQIFEQNQAQLETLLVLARLRNNELAQAQKPLRFELKLAKQARILMFPNTSVWILSEEELKSENKQWCKQWNIVRNQTGSKDEEKPLKICIRMQSKSNETSYNELLRWNFNLNMSKNAHSNSCLYVLNN